MTFQRLRKIHGSVALDMLAPAIDIAKGHHRVAIDIGFKENQGKFLSGETDELERFSIGAAITMAQRLTQTNMESMRDSAGKRYEPQYAIMGLGMGSRLQATAPEGIRNMVMLRTTSVLSRVQYNEAMQTNGSMIMVNSGNIYALNEDTGKNFRIRAYQAYIHPSAEILLAQRSVERETEDTFCIGKATKNVRLVELILKATEGFGPGKLFVLIAGKIANPAYVALRPKGLTAGKQFDSEERSYPDFIKIPTAKKELGWVLATVDGEKVHAHLFSKAVKKTGGHIEDAVIAPRSMIMVAKPHEIVSYDG